MVDKCLSRRLVTARSRSDSFESFLLRIRILCDAKGIPRTISAAQYLQDPASCQARAAKLPRSKWFTNSLKLKAMARHDVFTATWQPMRQADALSLPPCPPNAQNRSELRHVKRQTFS